MKALVIHQPGDLNSLRVTEVATPSPSADRVRVRVKAAGLNRADILQTRGLYPAPPGVSTQIPGLEFAGEVESVGPDVTLWKPGDRVFGLVGGGAFAEFVVVPEGVLARVPNRLDDLQAAAVPEAFITAQDALETQGKLLPGQTVLIHAVGGGIGSAAVQVAHAMGCRVLGTSRTADKLERLRPLGLDLGIDTSKHNFAQVVKDQTGGSGVPVVIDFLGASAFAANIEALAVRGTLVLVGQLDGSSASVELRALMAKRATVVATTLRSRPLVEKVEVTRRFVESVVPWLDAERVRPVVDQVYPFEQVSLAVERMLSNLGFGKVVLHL